MGKEGKLRSSAGGGCFCDRDSKKSFQSTSQEIEEVKTGERKIGKCNSRLPMTYLNRFCPP